MTSKKKEKERKKAGTGNTAKEVNVFVLPRMRSGLNLKNQQF
jgi:hypothetical protein